MEPSLRIITRMPLEELWDERGSVNARRLRDLQAEELRDLLRDGPLRFVVAGIGLPLRWKPQEECFTFWKEEVQPHLAHPDGPAALEEFADRYCYFASEWTPAAGVPIVLLELRH